MSFMEKTIKYDAKKFLIVVFSIQCALIGSIVLDSLNFPVPILRQAIGFVYLTFVPGIVLYRAFKLQKLTYLESIMCIIGLSILFLMFTGFFMNGIGYPYLPEPISVAPLTLVISIIVSILSLLCYIRDKNSKIYDDSKNHSLSLSLLFLCIIPLLSLIGSYMVNYYHTNVIMIIDILLICTVLALIIFTDLLPRRLYPFAIFSISISLLFNNSLASTFLDGWDIHYEYYYANLVVLNSLWDSTIPSNVNAMLSIVMLAPIYSEICNLELTYVFKIIFPFIFAMLPVGIYHMYQKQIKNEKIAFLSVFYFVSVYTFFTEMLALARQQIAELFLVLLFLIILSDLESVKKRILIVLFILGLIISHYGLSYLILLFMPVGYLFMTYILKSKSDTYTINFILLFFVFSLIWYINITQGSIFETIINIFNHIHRNIMDEFFATSSIELATSKSPFLSGQILKLLYLVSQFFIVIGFVKVFVQSKTFNMSHEYLSFSFVLLCILISSFLTSFTGMNIHRLYHMTSIFLSLFSVIGGMAVFQFMFNALDKKEPSRSFGNSLRALAVFFAIFLLFNTGFGQQIIHDNPASTSINREWIRNSDNLEFQYFLYEVHFPSQDVISTEWLSKSRNSQARIYADLSSTELLFYSYGMTPYETVLTNTSKIEPSSYLYLRYPNVRYGLMYGPKKGMKWSTSDALPLLTQKNLIYSNYDNFIYKF